MLFSINELHDVVRNNNMEFLIEFHLNMLNLVNSDQKTLLHTACSNGSETIVDYLLENNVEIDAVDDLGHTPIQYAVINNHASIFEKLRSRSTQINEKDLLSLAYESGASEIIPILQSSLKDDIDITDILSKIISNAISRRRNNDKYDNTAYNLLLSIKNPPNPLINITVNGARKALIQTLIRGRMVKTMKYFIDRDPNLIDTKIDGKSLLEFIIRSDRVYQPEDLEILKMIAGSVSSLNSITSSDILMKVVRGCNCGNCPEPNPDVLRILVSNGIKLEINDEFITDWTRRNVSKRFHDQTVAIVTEIFSSMYGKLSYLEDFNYCNILGFHLRLGNLDTCDKLISEKEKFFRNHNCESSNCQTPILKVILYSRNIKDEIKLIKMQEYINLGVNFSNKDRIDYIGIYLKSKSEGRMSVVRKVLQQLFDYGLRVHKPLREYTGKYKFLLAIEFDLAKNKYDLINREPLSNLIKKGKTFADNCRKLIILHNDVVWRLDDLYNYFTKIIKGSNIYDKHMEDLAGQNICDQKDFDTLFESTYNINGSSLGRLLRNYMDTSKFFENFKQSDFEFLRKTCSIFWAKGSLFDETIKEILTESELEEWKSKKEGRTSDEMPRGMSVSLSAKLEKLKQEQIFLYHQFYTNLTDIQKATFGSISSNVGSKSRIDQVCDGGDCIMCYGASMHNFINKIKNGMKTHSFKDSSENSN